MSVSAFYDRFERHAHGEGLKAHSTHYCPGCGHGVIVRDWHSILHYDLSHDGHCLECRTPVAGRFEAFTAPWGPKRQPVRLARAAQ